MDYRWGSTVRLLKWSSPLRKSVNAWGLGLRMPSKTPNPVIQVINRNEKDIRLLSRTGNGRNQPNCHYDMYKAYVKRG